jgi:extradiol dioxygenase family protein
VEGLPPFHLAIKVRDLTEARRFYGELLGCPEGRSSTTWVDFNFFGHQLVCHVARHISFVSQEESNLVDGHDVPIPHFGAVLEIPNFESLSRKLEASGVRFVVEPHVRFKGQPGEQATMFLLDPSGNAIEFKAFRNIREQLFAR